MEVTLTLPDDLYRRAEDLARRSRREISQVLTETLRDSLSGSSAGDPEDLPTVEELPDDAVRALAQSRIEVDRDERLSRLLERQEEETITLAERYELGDLMRVYREGTLRKARALREAVRRGLIEPLAS